MVKVNIAIGEVEILFEYQKRLDSILIGGNKEIVKFLCLKCGVKQDAEFKIDNQYKQKGVVVIKDLNLLEIETVELFVKNTACEQFQIFSGIDDHFNSTNLLFGSENEKSHYHPDHFESAMLMIKYSKFEDDEKEILMGAVRDFYLEIDAVEFVAREFEDLENLFIVNCFVKEIENQDVDLELRLQKLAEILKKLRLSIFKNNEVIGTRSYSYKKRAAEIVNTSLVKFNDRICESLEYYIKILNNEDYQNLLEDHEPREFLLGKLIENKNKLSTYLKIEKKLVQSRFLSPTFEKWLGTPLQLIEFYQFCEHNKIFNSRYEKNSKGVKILRRLYRFQEGLSIDKPSKRKKAKANPKSNFHSYYSLL